MVRRRLDGHLEAEITRTISIYPDWTPAQIHAYINRGAVPERVSRRTIARRMKEARHAEADAAWSFLDSEPEDAVLVLATERYASMDDSPSDGQGLFRLSRKEAEWVIRLKRGFPELQAPEHEAYVLFLSAIASWSDVFPLEVIEELLAYAPWRDDGRGLWSAFEADAARWQVIQLAIAMFTDGGASLPTDFATSLEAGLGRDVLVARTLPNGRLSYIDLEGELKALQAQISERGRERGSWRSTHER